MTNKGQVNVRNPVMIVADEIAGALNGPCFVVRPDMDRMRTGTIASYSSGSQTDLEKYLIHTNVYSGDSGGPVFSVRSRGAPALLGLISERIGPNAGEVPLAVAIDSTVIRETLALLPRNRIAPDGGSVDKRLGSRTTSSPTVKLVGSRDLLKKS